MVFIAGLTLAVALLAWNHSRPETLEQAAVRLNGCLLKGDVDCVDQYVWDHERAGLSLSKQKVANYLNEILLPNLKGWHPIGGLGYVLSQEQGLLLVHQEVGDERGRRASFSTDVFMTSDGPKADIVASTLFRSFTARFHVDDPVLSGPARQNVSWYLGLNAEKDKLNAMGIHGFISSKPGEGLRTWDGFLHRTHLVLAEFNVDLKKYESRSKAP